MTDLLASLAVVGALGIVAAALFLQWRRRVAVQPWEVALLYRDGTYRRTLPPGNHAIIGLASRDTVVTLPAHPQHLAAGPLDVIASDRFAFRLHVALTVTFPDPRAAYEAQVLTTHGLVSTQHLHDRVATAALAATGTTTLDEAVGDPPALAAAIADRLASAGMPADIASLAVTRIELPPETRRMLTEVVRAQREGQAALERSRAEQASLRALANAARLIRDNPELGKLRLLRTIEEARGPTTIVVGDPRMGSGG